MAHYDLIIAGIASLSLILLIMMFITRSLVAALVIVGTVALSLGASVGLSVLVWQHLLGIQLYWVILPLAVILLLAVGSDYNLLLVSRFKEEIHAGINTGIIRSMAGSGSVVTAAGLVFAFTMASFIFSDLLRARPDRHDDRARPAVRHADRAIVHDTVHRRAARAVVLVAGAGAPTAGTAEVRRREHAPAFAVLNGRPTHGGLPFSVAASARLARRDRTDAFPIRTQPARAGALGDVRTDHGVDECRPIDIGAK